VDVLPASILPENEDEFICSHCLEHGHAH
jgi:hypothetical protein